MPIGPTPAPYADARALSGLLTVMFFLAACWYLSASEGIVEGAGNHTVGRDFINLWTAGRLVCEGRAETTFDVHGFHAVQESLAGREFSLHLWSYPPHFLFVVAPLGLLGYWVGLAVWSIVTMALYAWAAGRPRTETMLLLAAAPATLVNLACGQTGALAAALLFGGLRAMRDRPALAGMLFGLLTFKPQLGLLVPLVLLLERRWQVIAWAAATALTLMGLSVLVFGPELWRLYLHENFAVTRSYLETGRGPFMDMSPSAFMALRVWGADLRVAYAVQGAVAVAVVAGLIAAWRSCAPVELKIAVTGVAALLVSPYAHNYDMTLISVGVLAAYGFSGPSRGRGRRAFLAAVWLLPLAMMPLHHSRIAVAPWLLLAFFGLLLAEARAVRRDANAV
ncbi:MAG: DUF2029 domain-containing protein [Gemmataceae bacterium]|nr:DUF2029 domain-containing protein [Gemmataceae bacterium]